MTKAELIKMLAPLPNEAKVLAWDPDTEQYEEVSGCIITPLGVVELQTDDIS